MKGKIPVRAAEKLSRDYDCPVVVIYAIHDGGERFTVTTYGRTRALCRHAADIGDKIAEAILSGTVAPAVREPMHRPDEPAVTDYRRGE